VPDDIIKEYRSPSKPGAGRKLRAEAWVVGVADPTGHLPEGHVYVSGLDQTLSEQSLHHVFLTRSPCVQPEDGILVPVVTKKPPNMPDEEWESLRSRRLGEVIFSCRGPPLPQSIADGDCDGDLYFVCWDSQVLKCIQSHDAGSGKCCTHVVDTAANNVKVNDVLDPNFAAQWLYRAQQHMTNTEALAEKMLIGKLYNAMIRKADASMEGLKDPDAHALAEAYVQAIDHGKHGDGISLPQHLRAELGMDRAGQQCSPPQATAAKADRKGWFTNLFRR